MIFDPRPGPPREPTIRFATGPLADRLPPHNLRAEMGCLGSILLDPDAIHEIRRHVRPEDFYRDDHAELYRILLAMADDARPLDAIAVDEELTTSGQFDELGSRDLLRDLLEATPNPADGEYYAKIVRQKAIGRELIGLANQMLRDAYSGMIAADDLVEEAQRAVLAIGEGRTGEETSDAHGAVTEALGGLADRDAGIAPGLSTGFAGLDRMTGGLQPGQLIVIAARPSIGKSALALNVAEHVAIPHPRSGRGPTPVLFASLEMSRRELGDRLLCGRAGVDGFLFRHSHRLLDEHRDRLARAAEDLSAAPIAIDDSASRTITQLATIARRLKSRRDLGLLIVDYLQLVPPEAESARRPRHEIVAEFSARFKGLAKELNIPILLLSQLNREVERREDKRPQLSDIRESGAVEQDANLILLLHRPEFYDEEDRPGQAEVIVAKNRSGPTGIVPLRFDRRSTRFGDHPEPPR